MRTQIVPYLDQLRSLAAKVESEDSERTLRLAFAAAGVPSSTYYRAHYGADLKAETADKVAKALGRMAGRTVKDGRRQAEVFSVDPA